MPRKERANVLLELLKIARAGMLVLLVDLGSKIGMGQVTEFQDLPLQGRTQTISAQHRKA